jgi:hypothetical protein
MPSPGAMIIAPFPWPDTPYAIVYLLGQKTTTEKQRNRPSKHKNIGTFHNIITLWDNCNLIFSLIVAFPFNYYIL